MSNIKSLDYHRKSLAELQRVVMAHEKELLRIKELDDWRDAVVSSVEVELAELRHEIKALVETTLDEVKALNVAVHALTRGVNK